MKDNDLSADLTRRYWVTSDVVFNKTVTIETKKTGWFRTVQKDSITLSPDYGLLSMIWRWCSSAGVRVELIFFDTNPRDALAMWEVLDKAANPFNEYFVFGSLNDAVNMIPYRPDLMGVVDIPERSAVFGGKGLTIANLH